MITPTGSMTASSERPIRLRMRADLDTCRQTYLGRSYWVVKDPLKLKFYRFEEEEFAILRMVDGRASAAEIQHRFARQFAPQRVTLTQIESLVSHLFQHALVVSDAPEQGRQLYQRNRRQRWQEVLASWSNVLSIRFPGFNPDGFLTGLNRCGGWLFSWPAVLVSLLFVAAALLLVAVQFDLFVQRLPGFQQFFAARNWLLLAAVMAGTKVLHEWGHGLACKRHGGQCHEMGLMLLVLTPCLYCNVSDSWMLRSKWRRAAIGAAGMYVELVLAAVCTFLWWFSDVGLFHYLCLNVMFVCSVSTVLFNANPLLRYDGYFILADLLEIPNLRQKSSTLLQRSMSQWFLGLSPQDDPFLPKRRRGLSVAYAVAAFLYRWVVVVSILWFLYRVFAPYGLEIVGQLLVAVAMYGLIFDPVRRLARFLRVPGRTRQVKKLRMLATTALLVSVLAGVLLAPVPFFVACDFHVQPEGATSVYVDVSGTLTSIHVREGEIVQQGQPLVTLGNIDIELAITRLEGDREQLSAKLAGLQLQAYSDEAALLEMAEVSESLAAVDHRIAQRRQDLQRLAIRAPCSGAVFAAPFVPPPEDSERLPTWSGHPLQNENLTSHLSEGVAVCQIGDPQQLEVILAVSEDAVKFVRSGQQVELYFDQRRGEHFSGAIAQVSETDMYITPVHFSGPVGRDMPGQDRSQRHRPSVSNTYQASLPFHAQGTTVLAGGWGRAKIRVGYRSLGLRLWDSLCRTFHFEMVST